MGSKNSIVIASNGETTHVLLNGKPISAERIEFKADGLDGAEFSLKGIRLSMSEDERSFAEYLRRDLGYEL